MNDITYKPIQSKIVKHESKEYVVFNASGDKANYSQRKSEFVFHKNEFTTNWASMCNVHVIAMGLSYLGYEEKFKSLLREQSPDFQRFPDKLANFMFSDKRVKEFYKQYIPWEYAKFERGEKDAFGPNEIHAVLSYAVNLFFGINVTYFSTKVNWKDICNEIIFNGKTLGVSGKFGNLNHIVNLCGVGYEMRRWETEVRDKISSKFFLPDIVVYDDPYGKTYEYNKGLSGNDVIIPFEKAVADLKPTNSEKFKMAHKFISPEELGVF